MSTLLFMWFFRSIFGQISCIMMPTANLRDAKPSIASIRFAVPRLRGSRYHPPPDPMRCVTARLGPNFGTRGSLLPRSGAQREEAPQGDSAGVGSWFLGQWVGTQAH